MKIDAVPLVQTRPVNAPLSLRCGTESASKAQCSSAEQACAAQGGGRKAGGVLYGFINYRVIQTIPIYGDIR